MDTPVDLDIDHLVPLKNTHDSGGWAWSSARKEDYANYLGDPDHLIAVTNTANRPKGAKGPGEWRPPDREYWCQYATDWTEVKFEWGLSMTQREAETAGEARVQGSMGVGRGFPQAMVPGARDGDGDGVVCER